MLILQRPPTKAKATWFDHGIRDHWLEEFDREHWPEKVDNEIYPHVKPLGLISRLISAITERGDLVVDPAAGSFVVMRATHELGRDFIGCEIAYQPEARGAERDAA